MARLGQFSNEFLCNLISEGIADDDCHLFLNRLDFFIVKVILAKQMNTVHSACFFQTACPFQIDAVAQFAIVLVKGQLNLLYAIKRFTCRIYFEIQLRGLAIILVSQIVICLIAMDVLVCRVQCQ